MHVYIFLQIQEKGDIYVYIHVEWIFCFRKSKIKSIKNRLLSSQLERIQKTGKVMNSLKKICDAEDKTSSEERPFSTVRKTDRDRSRKALPTDSSNESEIEEMRNDSDSNEDSNVSVGKTKKSSRAIRSHRKIEKLKSRTKNTTSDNEDKSYKNSSLSDVSVISKNTHHHLKYATQNKKRNVGSYNPIHAKNKTKYCDSSSESEDIDYEKQTKHPVNHRKMSHSNGEKEQKRNKSLNKHFLQKTQKDDSDSSEVFQKEKLIRTKRSMRQLPNLNIDYTHSPKAKDLANSKKRESKSQKNVDVNHSNLNLDNLKEILNECKLICSNFQKYIDAIEQLYDVENEEQLLQRSMRRMDKLMVILNKKQNGLTNLHRMWSEHSKKKNSGKNLQKVLNNKRFSKQLSVSIERIDEKKLYKFKNEQKGKEIDEDSLSLCESRNELENKEIDQDENLSTCKSENEQENKEVSECDSDEIFSYPDKKLSQKMQTDDIANELKTENSRDCNEDSSSMHESNNSNTDLQQTPVNSPVLDSLKERKAEKSNKSLLGCNDSTDNKTPLIDNDTDSGNNQGNNTNIYDNETELEESLNKTDRWVENMDVMNNSMDLFDTSFDNPENMENNMNAQKSDTETDCDKVRSSRAADIKEENSQEKAESETDNRKINDANGSKKTDVVEKVSDDNESSLIDAEILAKKALLESDCDDNVSSPPVADLTKQIEKSITDDTDSKKQNEGAEDDSEIDSRSSAVNYDSSREKKKESKEKGIDSAKVAQVKDQSSDHKSDRENSRDVRSSSEDEVKQLAKMNENAKKAILESNDSISSSSVASEEVTARNKTEIDVAADEANAKAKKALLASSDSEKSYFDLSASMARQDNTGVSTSNDRKRSIKRSHDLESDNSIISTIKKKRLKLSKNYYYRNDKKLRIYCEVCVERLDEKVLERYSHALQKSREYLEHKELQRYQEVSLKSMSFILRRLK